MESKNVLISIVFAASVLSVGCATHPTVAHFKQEKNVEFLSFEAYQRAEPKLSALKPGDGIWSKIDTHSWSLKEQGRESLYIGADGWVGPLSGNLRGAWFGLGKITGRSGDTLSGEHVFGYLLGEATLKPQYIVVTEATHIELDEYDVLKSKKADNIGWTLMPRDDKHKHTHFKDIRVKEVRRIGFSEGKELEGAAIKKAGNITDIIGSLTTRERFQAAEERLKTLVPGTDFWEATIKELNGIWFTYNKGLDYILLTDGHIGGSWHMLTSKGYFSVLRFGYMENGNEVPKLALIFKNNKVHKLVTHASKEELQRYFE